jgi:hypothetical protein
VLPQCAALLALLAGGASSLQPCITITMLVTDRGHLITATVTLCHVVSTSSQLIRSHEHESCSQDPQDQQLNSTTAGNTEHHIREESPMCEALVRSQDSHPCQLPECLDSTSLAHADQHINKISSARKAQHTDT